MVGFSGHPYYIARIARSSLQLSCLIKKMMTKMNELDLCMRSYQLKVMPTIVAPHSPVNISETVFRPRDRGLVGSKRSPIGNGLWRVEVT